ncbi:formylglycine-generating enzyme family protein [Patescibacteria group bacterium]|nr:formylglycine-generating enzyme family protein [Patescibacteria group bacterium]
MTPRAKRRNWHKGLLIGLGAFVLSTVGIQASDMANGISGKLMGSAVTSSGPCNEHEVLLRFGAYALCIDSYEASPAHTCPYRSATGDSATVSNVETPACVPVSQPGQEPWRFVSYTEATQLCARAGKRLPTAQEWYRVAVGQADTESCVLDATSPALTGSANCVSPLGVHDLVGNVWEWMGDTVSDGMIEGRHVPMSGYVELVDDGGVVLKTSNQPVPAFGDDYAWVQHEGVRGMLRGGFYTSGSDGGVFAQNMSVALDFAAAGVGFRCVRDVQ